jgi:hypothetical protein
MKLTEQEQAAAKRAAKRLWCHGDPDGKHLLKPYVFPDMSMGYKCAKCDFQSKAKEVKP